MIRWPAPDEWEKTFPELCGRKHLSIRCLSSLNHVKDNSLLYVFKMTKEVLNSLMGHENCLLFLNQADGDICDPLEEFHGVVYSANPRYRYAEVLGSLWDSRALRSGLVWKNDCSTIVHENVKIDPSSIIESGVTIAGDSVIEGNVYVMSGARIGPRVQVGEGTVVRENAVIGGYGFGFARAPGKPSIRIPHVGGVLIGKNVEIGALTTVCSGISEPTVIEDNVIIDDHVHVAHGCHIEEGAIITACAEISGSVRIGRGTWLAPNCSIINGITIGSGCMVGIGAVVTKPVPDHTTVAGNPARRLPLQLPKRE